MLQKIIVAAGFVSLAACSQPSPDTNTSAPAPKTAEPRLDWTPPPAGTTVAVVEKKLKRATVVGGAFRISVVTTDSSQAGHYRIHAEYNGALHDLAYDLPEWNDDRILKPMVRLIDTVAYGSEIGFDSGNGNFRPYYTIIATPGVDEMNIKQVATYMLSR